MADFFVVDMQYVMDYCVTCEVVTASEPDVKNKALYTPEIRTTRRRTCRRSVLQGDLDAVWKWSITWQLPLNLDKCTVLHMGKHNPNHSYYLSHHAIKSVASQSDLGVIVTEDLSWSEHIAAASNKAKRMSLLLQKTFGRCDPHTCSVLYTTYIRPILEYADPVWAPVLARDEKAHFKERLSLMHLTPFANRRLRGDLITTYRALHGLFNVDVSHLFCLNADTRLRGHNFKLTKERFRSTSREFFLPNRVFNSWNGLPTAAVNACSSACSVNGFKSAMDRWFASVSS
ncbi:uncharacterized protein LOC123307558 [Coccinella septempunctata]|uniref:uncharacterized protein LOC123307558 n=1 Tax=Coccinella septempunctata TaxID=41139 RepID=UPI001D06E155|nr:uncharacterized protein LOC123307558 [Coccinella septempunctata]